MKKTFRILLAVAVASACAACTDDIDNSIPTPDGTGKTVPVKISAAAPADESAAESTRTIIDINGGTFTTRWENGDRMGVKYAYNNGAAQSGVGEFTYDKASGKFTSVLPAYTGAWSYEAAMPYSADSHGSATFGNLRIQKGNAFNSAHDLLVATPVTTTNADAGKDDNGNELTFTFARQTPILKVRITGGSTSDVIQTVLLTATDGQAISSDKYDATEGLNTAIDATSGISPASNVIAMQFETGTAPTAADAEVYFNIPAGTYNGLQVDVITADGKIAGRKLNTAVTASPGKLSLLNLEGLTFKAVAGNKNLEPSLNWLDQDMNAVHDIVDENKDGILDYSASIDINAPAGIAKLKIGISSNYLNGLGIDSLDLFNETSILGQIAFNDIGLDCGTKIQYKKSIKFDITALVTLITDEPGQLHRFNIIVTDLSGNHGNQTLTFRTPETEIVAEPTITYKSADAWTNTATLELANVPTTAQTVTVEYKTTAGTNWLPATVNADRTTATIAPQWKEYTAADWTTPNAVNTFYRIVSGTGVSRGNTYQYRMTIDGKVYEGPNFAGPRTTNTAIATLDDSTLPCYNATEASDWWNSGNNSTTPKLCTYDETSYYCAHLATKFTSINLFVTKIEALAAGNLFSGTFKMNGTNGTVNFGQAYTWKARPKAIKINYDAKIGTVDFQKYKAGDNYPIAANVRDYARIFIAIVDWTSPRKVTSGTSAPTGMWDPETQSTMPDNATYGGGKIIGYASAWIQQDALTGALQTEEIPINYYDKEAKPTTGNYSIVISCSANAYGDYMCGCKTNEMYVGDFEWVY